MEQRSTRQRIAIRRAFEGAGRPLNAQEVLEAAKQYAPTLGIATVYRALRGLTEEGELTMVELPGEPPRYEPASLAHHHHFSCRTCGRLFELTHCVGDFAGLTPPGFVTEAHELVLYGRCESCAGPSRARPKERPRADERVTTPRRTGHRH